MNWGSGPRWDLGDPGPDHPTAGSGTLPTGLRFAFMVLVLAVVLGGPLAVFLLTGPSSGPKPDPTPAETQQAR